MAHDPSWASQETLAWSRADGPEAPPRGPSRWLVASVAGVLGVTLTSILAADVLCPDHRAWVQALGSIAIVASVVAIGLALRDHVLAGFFALVASGFGVAIGGLDAVHSPVRGRFLMLGFALAAAGSGILAFRIAALSHWDRRLADAHRVVDDVAAAPSTSPVRPDDGPAVGDTHDAGIRVPAGDAGTDRAR